MTSRTITCVVLNWNGGDRIIRCLRSLAASKGVSVKLVVVDNGSLDNSLERIVLEFPSIHVIQFPSNEGLARARNEGIAWARGQDDGPILLIDNDAYVAEDCLGKLVAALDEVPKAGIATPRILDGRNKEEIWYDGGEVGPFGNTRHRNMGRLSSDVGIEKPTLIAFATGCCMLMKGEMFETTGLLDELYFVYCEDADFSFRAIAKGFAIVHVSAAQAWHDQSSDTKANKGKWFRDYYLTRNTLLLFSRHYSRLRKSMAMISFGLSGVGGRLLFFLVTGQFRRCNAIVMGVIDFFRKRLGKRYA